MPTKEDFKAVNIHQLPTVINLIKTVHLNIKKQPYEKYS